MFERISSPGYDDLAVPDVVLGLYDWVIAWDHQAQRAWAISTGIPEQGTARTERAAWRLAFEKERLADIRIRRSAAADTARSPPTAYSAYPPPAPYYPAPALSS